MNLLDWLFAPLATFRARRRIRARLAEIAAI